MTIATTTPQDQNLLQGSKFTLNFDRLPYVEFFVQNVNIPGMKVNNLTQPTPFRNAPIPGNKIEYDNLIMEFIIDEQLLSWLSIRNWMSGYSFPESFEQYKNLSMQEKIQISGSKPQYSDASLTIMTNKNNPIITFSFSDVFPVSLGGIELSTKNSALNVKTCMAEFQFTNYDIKKFG